MPKIDSRLSEPMTSGLLAVIFVIFVGGVFWLYLYEREELQHELIEFEQDQAEQHGQDFARLIGHLYQQLRTIARLPATREIDRYAKLINPLDIQAIQEIYNNLFLNIRLSEVYIVPLQFDPDALDPRTGQLQKPIITFDQFIVGKTIAHTKNTRTENEKALEEVEIYEYRAMKQQLQWFKRNTPDDKLIKNLSYPALSSAQIITCDNSFVDATDASNGGKDHRLGIVYSVPFFDLQGQLKGMVSGVVLSKVINDIFKGTSFVLYNQNQNLYFSGSKLDRKVNDVANYIQTKHDFYLFEQHKSIPTIIDNSGDWKLWMGVKHEDIENYPALMKEKYLWQLSALLAFVMGVGALIVFYLLRRQRAVVLKQNQMLEDKVYARTKELHQLNQALVQSNNIKSEFLSRVSHELRTPLNAIIGFSELIYDEASEQGLQSIVADILKISRSGSHLLTLINEIMDISRIESGKAELSVEEIEICALLKEVAEAVEPLIQKQCNRLQFICEDNIGLIQNDYQRLRQILFNLLSNAAKFTSNGMVTIRAEALGNMIRVEVEDNGVGMSEEQLERIFEEFYQGDQSSLADSEGAGLGLAITKRLCFLLQGAIEVSSEPGKGTRFVVSFPRVVRPVFAMAN
ncbi:MAG: HAMP domain-containing histidine kinase [Gammaproteobacteria bacterium]|nr:HAMP domain-containing histidine kinase [Gammaproteobacteria bacterium]